LRNQRAAHRHVIDHHHAQGFLRLILFRLFLWGVSPQHTDWTLGAEL
jgi:hypothetical protein